MNLRNNQIQSHNKGQHMIQRKDQRTDQRTNQIGSKKRSEQDNEMIRKDHKKIRKYH